MALDAGSAKTCVLVADEGEQGKLKFRGWGCSESKGWKKGAIINLEAAVLSIRLAMEAAEESAATPIERAVVGLGGAQVKGLNCRGGVNISSRHREIQKDDVRRAMIEQIAWVESADTARLWPNRILVVIRERTPVAFLRTAASLVLVDSTGQLLDRPAQASFSFPVVTGMSELDPPDERRRRMALFNAVMQDLDREGAHYTKELSEVDVSDPEDARVVTGETAVLLHLGRDGFLQRYKTYLSHIQEWRQSIPKIHSVDLRYDRQIVVN